LLVSVVDCEVAVPGWEVLLVVDVELIDEVEVIEGLVRVVVDLVEVAAETVNCA
jgi:hypothetical protein